MAYITPANDPRVKRGTSGFELFKDDLNDFGNWLGDTFFGGSNQTNITNENIAKENIEYQKEANEQNIAFIKAENEITRMREDNAVQRAAADMTAAGLSKTLAAGNPASAAALSPPQVEAPNNSFQMQKNLAGLSMMNFISDLHFKKKEDKRADELNDAQVAKLEAEAAGQLLSNSTHMENFTNEQAIKVAQKDLINANTNLVNANTNLQNIIGDKKADEVQSIIDKNVAETLLANSGKKLNDQQLSKLIEETKNEIRKGTGLYWDNNKKEQEYELLLVDIIKSKIESNILTQNLWYGVYNGLPVGNVPNGIIGGMYNTSQAIAAGMSNSGFALKFPYGLDIAYASPTGLNVPPVI